MSGSPWGNGGNDRPPGNGGGNKRPPNIDDLAGQFQDSLKKMFPGKKYPEETNQYFYLELLF